MGTSQSSKRETDTIPRWQWWQWQLLRHGKWVTKLSSYSLNTCCYPHKSTNTDTYAWTSWHEALKCTQYIYLKILLFMSMQAVNHQLQPHIANHISCSITFKNLLSLIRNMRERRAFSPIRGVFLEAFSCLQLRANWGRHIKLNTSLKRDPHNSACYVISHNLNIVNEFRQQLFSLTGLSF